MSTPNPKAINATAKKNTQPNIASSEHLRNTNLLLFCLSKIYEIRRQAAAEANALSANDNDDDTGRIHA